MGKTPKPLKIVALPPISDWPEITALAEQGHQVILGYENAYDALNADLVLGPTCWFMDEQHRKYLDLAIAEARRRRYPKETKNE